MGCCSKGNTEHHDAVLEALKSSEEPLKTAEIAEKCGLDKDLVAKSITKLKKDGKVTSPKRCYYTIGE